MNNIGIIDIGANSVRLMISEVDDNGFYRIIDELNTPIRLCEDLIHSSLISEEKICLTLSTLKSYKTLCNVSGVKEIFTVANDTLQQATNKDEIFSRITTELNLDVDFLTPEEDISLTFLGVKTGIYLDSGLIVDIEGSSTHIIEYVNGEIKNTAHIPLGSVNTSYLFNLNDRVLKESLTEAENSINNYLKKYNWITSSSHKTVIGIGGTFRSLSKINRINRRYLLDLIHNYKLEDRDLYDCFNMLKTKDLRQRKKVEGLSSSRSDIIIGGSLIIKTIIDMLDEPTIIVSGRGLRDGIVEKIIMPNKKHSDILDYSLERLVSSLNLNKNHGEQVFWITKTLFNKLTPLHRLS
ncbi:MAG: Ppx/GppA phosphatase family protein, partial [Clostridium sp.]